MVGFRRLALMSVFVSVNSAGCMDFEVIYSRTTDVINW
jgi:ribosomal protein S27E